jgi:hypothetical protein
VNLEGKLMATKAQTAKPDYRPVSGNRWWQWVLLYPAFAISLITSIPDLADKALAKYYDAGQSSYAEAKRQTELWKNNFECLIAPTDFSPNLDNINVDATICKKTGDIFVQIEMPDKKSVKHWVDLKEILAEGNASSGGLIPSAKASVPSAEQTFAPVIQANNASKIKAVQFAQAVVVVCQKFVDQRLLLRHIRTPQGCYDEIIDTFNGQVVRRNVVPCRGGC